MENIERKGEIAGEQHSLPLSQCFPKFTIINWQNFKAFADDKLKVIKMAKFVLDKTENVEGKEEIAGYQHFLLFPQCFQKAFSLGSLEGLITLFALNFWLSSVFPFS